MRANGYGNSIFSLICKLLVLRYLENEHVREPQFDPLRWGMTYGAQHAKRLPRQRLRCVLGMISSLEVQVLYPT